MSASNSKENDKSDFFSFNRMLLDEFAKRLPEELAKIVQEEQQKELVDSLKAAIKELDSNPADGQYLAQNWLFSFIGNHPQLTPLVPRDLLWFLGGDCLHFMTDEEINAFQKIEDRITENPELSWVEARRQSLN
ncbi:hypothetical protein M3P05_14375 [Sansalvadorimonas sp. 2012CJ34-2]|uniref:Dehydrogenase n=1 Tax=Parendozoicomonas callyspongiae TaxID=2942213 RepID=A0ABT0PKZ2_9GAMM|nr:PA2817 family protein [Sansalvadorimonas sp. 2012CJ34-2]MCL6271108.1 hypothetical protein [Sansalvadorimonas sp. 2012CJ34-2]